MTSDPRADWESFLFDFDGTLVDSSALHAEAYYFALTRHRPELAVGFEYAGVKGMTTPAGFRKLGVEDDHHVALLSAAKQRHFRTSVSQGRLLPLPGARDLLEALSATGRTMFLVTSGSTGSVRPSLIASGLDHLFSGFVTSDDVVSGKPSPEPYRQCIDRFRLNPNTSVVIEDADSGVISARGNDLFVIGVHNASIFEGVDQYFSNLDDLRRWVLGHDLLPVPVQ